MSVTGYLHSVKINKANCRGCVACVKTCPTDAIRVRNGKAEIIENRCIDCGECIRNCIYHAAVAETDKVSGLEQYEYNVVLPAPSLYAQFPADVSTEIIWQGLHALGFDEIFDVALASEYISLEIEKIVTDPNNKRKPMISSTCPAVLRLIQVKFPELIPQIVPVLPPAEASAIYIKKQLVSKLNIPEEKIGVWFISPCPSKGTNIRQSVDVLKTEITGSFSVSEVYGKILKNLGKESALEQKVTTASSYGMGWGGYGGEIRSAGLKNAIAVHGIKDVYDVLEQISLNKMPNLDYVECSACEGGCIGGALAAENRFVAETNLKQRIVKMRTSEPATRKETLETTMVCEDFPTSSKYIKKLLPRPMMQLDDDIVEAMKKFEQMEEVLRALPGLDCGACGAPSCQCLAEDIVQGKANEIDCIFKLRSSVRKLAHGMVELSKQIPIAAENDDFDLENELTNSNAGGEEDEG